MADIAENRTVLLINPRATYVNEIAQKCYPPMNLLYLGAALREAGFEPVVLDANAFRMTDGQIADEVRRLGHLWRTLPKTGRSS